MAGVQAEGLREAGDPLVQPLLLLLAPSLVALLLLFLAQRFDGLAHVGLEVRDRTRGVAQGGHELAQVGIELHVLGALHLLPPAAVRGHQGLLEQVEAPRQTGVLLAQRAHLGGQVGIALQRVDGLGLGRTARVQAHDCDSGGRDAADGAGREGQGKGYLHLCFAPWLYSCSSPTVTVRVIVYSRSAVITISRSPRENSRFSSVVRVPSSSSSSGRRSPTETRSLPSRDTSKVLSIRPASSLPAPAMRSRPPRPPVRSGMSPEAESSISMTATV